MTSAPDPSTAGLLPVGPPVVATGSQVLTVGAGKQYATLAAAIAASSNGATILVDAGTYTNDFATITTKISIIGVGGMVNLVATVPPPNLKGILTVDNDVTIQNVSFSGAAISDADGGNGAGIRYEGGQMVLSNDSFSNNQDGLLANAVIAQIAVNTISIDHCVFKNNGSGSGYTHNLYVGAVQKLTATNSVFQGAVVGHEFKSRALVNDIEGNVFSDGPTGTASYDIDLPNGGTDLVRNNVIEKGPNAENNAMIHFGGEGIPYAGSSLTISGNSFVNDKGSGTLGVLNQTAISVAINGNSFAAIAAGQIVQGPATGTGNTDAQGNALPDISLTGVLPGNTLVFTDSAAHVVTLSNSIQAVQGGGGLLTVTAAVGHVVAIGGAGGMIYSEAAGTGGSSISTAVGSTNTITLAGQDLLDSEGTDIIVGGSGNITGQIGGNATIDDGTGNDTWSVLGTAVITGHGGNPVVTVGPQGSLTVTGGLGYLEVQNNGGNASIDIVQGGAREAISIAGGGVDVRVYNAAMQVTTSGGNQGTTLTLGAGTAQVTSLGADVIWAGSGAATVIVSGAAIIHAGTGVLSLYGHADTLGATLYGNGGDYLLGGDTGNITYIGGALASTIEAQLSNNTLIGGAGRLSVNGGSRETIVGGAGGLIYSATDGGGANVITTQAGSQNVLTLAGANTVNSYGQDTIQGGSGNQTMTVYGNAAITGSTGNSNLTFYGNDTLIGVGQDICSVFAGGTLTAQAGSFTSISETGGTAKLTIVSGANATSVTLTGGAATVTGGANTTASVTTTAGVITNITLGKGYTNLTLLGGDSVHAGSGAASISITAANTHIWGGNGSLIENNNDAANGDVQTLHGGAGAIQYSQGGGALVFLGGSGSANLNGGWGSITATAAAGNVTLKGGDVGTKFIAGSGSANLTLSPGYADVTFGTGTTAAQVAGWGQAELFRCVSGSGGGNDTITGFRDGTDQIILKGVTVASQTSSGGSTMITLSDSTHLTLVGLTNPSHIFGS